MSETTKKCSKCNEDKPISEFSFIRKADGVRHSQCNCCKYYPKPNGTNMRRCSDCGLLKHYKNDFPASNTCCKPCFVIRKRMRDAEKEASSQTQLPFQPVSPVIETHFIGRTPVETDEFFMQGVCHISIEEEPCDSFTQGVCNEIIEEEPTIFCKGRCQKNIPKSEFHKRNNTICKHCIQYDKHVQSRDVYWYLTYLYKSAKDRTKHEFSITIDEWYDIYFNQKGLSALSGKSMTHCVSPSLIEYEKYPNNISPDRKDSSKGYTKDNVQFCRWYENSMKNNMTEKDFFERVCEIADFYRNNIDKYK